MSVPPVFCCLVILHLLADECVFQIHYSRRGRDCLSPGRIMDKCQAAVACGPMDLSRIKSKWRVIAPEALDRAQRPVGESASLRTGHRNAVEIESNASLPARRIMIHSRLSKNSRCPSRWYDFKKACSHYIYSSFSTATTDFAEGERAELISVQKQNCPNFLKQLFHLSKHEKVNPALCL